MSKSQFLGGTFIVAGTAIGGGMLALPVASAFAGFYLSTFIMICMWALMAYTSLVTLEMNLYFNKGVSISYAAEHSLGQFGKIVSTAAIGLLFYALLSAYMAGGASLLRQIVFMTLGRELSSTALVIIFGGVFSGIILARTKIVDLTNRWLLLIKVICFIAIIASIFPKTDVSLLHYVPTEVQSYLPMLIPLFFTSFGFHGSIPTIVNYIGPDKRRLSFVFILGSAVPLLVYLLWEALALGVVPLEGPNSFTFIKEAGGDIGLFTHVLSSLGGGGWVVGACQGFMFLAIATSFLGVGIGLFDFMEEQLTRNNKKPSQYVTWLFTFVVPLAFALFYPKGFIMALGYAAIALSILAIIIPALVVYKIRMGIGCEKPRPHAYTVFGGKPGLAIILIFGIGVILLELRAMLG